MFLVISFYINFFILQQEPIFPLDSPGINLQQAQMCKNL
jgi:hypothetical protein